MNRNQKRVLSAGALLIILMCLFPPWQCTESIDFTRMGYSDGHGNSAIMKIRRDIRYAPVFRPPRRGAGQPPERRQATAFLLSAGVLHHHAAICYQRLLIQIAVVVGVLAVLLFLLRTGTGHSASNDNP